MAQSPRRHDRWRAAGIHLLGSLLVAIAAAALVFGLWYSWPYEILAGGLDLFKLITTVDVVLGPLITLLVFNRLKTWRVLRRDLYVVVALQVCALAYGLHVIYLARPVALALEVDRLRVVRDSEIVHDELPLAPPSLRRLSWTGPVKVRTERPTDATELAEAIEKAFAGFDLGARPKYWRSWDDKARQQVLAAGKRLDELQARYPARRLELLAAVQATGIEADGLRFLPMLSQQDDWVALIDARTGEIVGYAPFSAY